MSDPCVFTCIYIEHVFTFTVLLFVLMYGALRIEVTRFYWSFVPFCNVQFPFNVILVTASFTKT